jgi:diguanylate cyclase (GGDEF)-like protein
MIDLDHFKSINDRFGHSVGDRVLQIFAKTAAANLRSFDLIGRLGGEEFAAVLAESGQDEAVAVAERIRMSFVAAAAVVDGHAVAATTSVGVALMRDVSQGVTALLGQADKALYRAKDLGRNRVELAEPPAAEPARLAATPIGAMRGRTATAA